MFEFFKSLWKIEGQENIVTPLNEKITFELKYKDLLIGTLELKKGIWIFKYTEKFAEQDSMKPLIDFPNVDKVYKSKALYPFFVIRIPSIKQPKVKSIIAKEKIDETNEVALLKRFGRLSISNPFLLQVAEA